MSFFCSHFTRPHSCPYCPGSVRLHLLPDRQVSPLMLDIASALWSWAAAPRSPLVNSRIIFPPFYLWICRKNRLPFSTIIEISLFSHIMGLIWEYQPPQHPPHSFQIMQLCRFSWHQLQTSLSYRTRLPTAALDLWKKQTSVHSIWVPATTITETEEMFRAPLSQVYFYCFPGVFWKKMIS